MNMKKKQYLNPYVEVLIVQTEDVMKPGEATIAPYPSPHSGAPGLPILPAE